MYIILKSYLEWSLAEKGFRMFENPYQKQADRQRDTVAEWLTCNGQEAEEESLYLEFNSIRI